MLSGIAEDNSGAEAGVDDSRMWHTHRIQVCDPSLQFVSVRDSERQVVETHALFIERIGSRRAVMGHHCHPDT
jgi:hypothetical protein